MLLAGDMRRARCMLEVWLNRVVEADLKGDRNPYKLI
jgi:hypothetical protein